MIYSEAGAGVQLLGAAEARVDLLQQHSGNSYLLTTKKTQPSFMVEYWLNYELFYMHSIYFKKYQQLPYCIYMYILL